MKKITLALALLCLSAFAHANYIEYTCGTVHKLKNGKILRRLIPDPFGITKKYVLKTKLRDAKRYTYVKINRNQQVLESERIKKETVYTAFSSKRKFQLLKRGAKDSLKLAKRYDQKLYACVGRIEIPIRYYGAHIYWSSESLEAAKEQMDHQIQRHL